MDLRQWNGASYSPSKGDRGPPSAEYLAPKYSDARVAFDRYDKDHDHTLSKAECVDFVRGTGLAVTEQYIEGVWSVYDENGDGALDMAEFAIFYSVLAQRSETRRQQQPNALERAMWSFPEPSVHSRRGSFMDHSSRQRRGGPAPVERSANPLAGVPEGRSPSSPSAAPSGLAEIFRKSRAGEGSSPIIAFALAMLVIVLVVVGVLLANETDEEPSDLAGSAPEEEKSYWYIGVVMSCVACLANAFGYNWVRRAHTLVDRRQAEGDENARVMQHWQFPVGWFFSIVLCAGLDAFALSFTDPGLIAPLSGFTLVLNVWVAQFVNSEEVYAIDYAVTALILVGVIVTILSGPSAAPPLVDAEYLWSHVLRPPFLVYQVVMHSSALFVSRMAKKVYGDKTESGIAAGRLAHPRLSGVSPLLFPWVGAIYTAHMNVSVATLLQYLKGPTPEIFSEVGPYFCLGVLVTTSYIQLKAINDGLRTEGALIFVPIKCALNVAQVSLMSMLFFQTLDSMEGLQTARYLLGLASVIVGVLIITLRPDTEGAAGAGKDGGSGEVDNELATTRQ